MSEKFIGRPDVRLVGRPPQLPGSEDAQKRWNEDSATFKRHFQERFGDAHVEHLSEGFQAKLNELETEKPEYLKEVIQVINKWTNTMRVDAGVEPFDFPERNVHFFEFKKFPNAPRFARVAAFHSPTTQIIGLDTGEAVKNPIFTTSKLLHEVIHGKGFLSFTMNPPPDDDSYDVVLRRSGLSINNAGKEHNLGWFIGLEEAVTVMIEQRLLPFVVADSPSLQEPADKDYDSPAAIRAKAEVAEYEGVSVDDVLAAWPGAEGATDYALFSYLPQRQILGNIIRDIAEDNGLTAEEVTHLFIKAHFDGRLLEISRLMQKSFGDGALRVLAAMEDDPGGEDNIHFVFNSLKMMRKEILAKRSNGAV